MSSGVGVGNVHNPHIWRHSPDIHTLKDSLSLGSADDAGNFAGSRERVVRLVVGSLSVVDWVRSQWLPGLLVLSVALAYYRPVSQDIMLNPWTRILAFISFALSGASFTGFEQSTTLRFIGPTVSMCFMSFIVSPILGTAVYIALRENNNDANYLLMGLICTFCLPPSIILSLSAVRSSQGNETFSQYLSATGSVFGVIISPLIMLTCISFIHSIQFPSTTQMILFPVTLIGPFICGFIAQKGFSWASHRRITDEDHDALRHSKAEMACSELCDGSLVHWRQRTAQLNNIVLLVVNYLMFSSFFVQPLTHSVLTWRGVGLIACAESLLFIVICVVSWLLASLIVCTPEERIAFFFALITKSEVLIAPIILHLFYENRQAAVILVPSLIYYLIQVFATGMLSFPLRRWRYHYNCRPGTTLLPLRLSRGNRAPLTKS